MKTTPTLWDTVSSALVHGTLADAAGRGWLNSGQQSALRALGERLRVNRGCVIADEVGMGKTRIAVALAKTVVECGGRVCVALPPGLGAQWKTEFATGKFTDLPEVVRSLHGFYDGASNHGTYWQQKKIVLVSHLFTNWQIKGATARSRWYLLPLVYRAWYKSRHGQHPRGSSEYFKPSSREECSEFTARTPLAEAIGAYANSGTSQALELFFEDITDWRSLCDATSYSAGTAVRKALETVIGIGLGQFDLVIIDEAHKARGIASNLNRLLKNVLLRSPECRSLAMTATPVELCVEDWRQTLTRIAVPDDTNDAIIAAAQEYVNSLQRLRLCWRTDAAAREDFAEKAHIFQKVLSPYVLRRDKREDASVRAYAEKHAGDFYKYREIVESVVETSSLSPIWKQAICAAEALSLVSENDNTVLKRLRLTVGNAHGIASFLDMPQHNAIHDAAQDMDTDEWNTKNEAGSLRASPSSMVTVKRQERLAWWEKKLSAPFARKNGKEAALFEHPAILHAVECIESITKQGEKALVFGRFTRPLRGLTMLLNAREMVRRARDGAFWPQESLGKEMSQTSSTDAESGLLRAAIPFALRKLAPGMPLTDFEDALQKQYTKQTRAKKRFRDAFIATLEQGLEVSSKTNNSSKGNKFAFAALERLRQEGRVASEDTNSAVIANAIMEITGFDTASAVADIGSESFSRECAAAFMQLLNAFTDHSDAEDDESVTPLQWNEICAYLREEYRAPRGTFARLMYGQTKLPTQRMLQAAFNREAAWPRVLVAQSVVGREGLNLHEACRHVVLLHPEWNPGVVEQQIGRVDRLNSLWSRYVTNGDFSKPISIYPIIFRGTYDEHHWHVLFDRWNALRAQLYGEVLPAHELHAVDRMRYQDILAEIKGNAPSFSPVE